MPTGTAAARLPPIRTERQLRSEVNTTRRTVENRHITDVINRRMINEFNEAERREIFNEHTWAERVAQAHPECQAEILQILKRSRAEAGKREAALMLMNEAFSRIGWPPDMTQTGPRMREGRLKTYANLFKSANTSINLEMKALEKSLEFQARYIESLQPKGIGNLFRWFPTKKNRTRKAAIKTLRLNAKLVPAWERTAQETLIRLKQITDRAEALVQSENFNQKEADNLAELFDGTLKDYYGFRDTMRWSLIGPYASPVGRRIELRGKSYGKRQKSTFKRVGLEPGSAFAQVMQEIERGTRRERNAMRFVDKAMGNASNSMAERVARFAASQRNQN